MEIKLNHSGKIPKGEKMENNLDIKNTRLHHIEICVTSCCNLNCLHCYQKEDKNKYILPYDSILDLISFAKARECRIIILTGGEYFTYPYAYDLLHYLTSNSNFTLSVVTNGTVLNQQLISTLPRDRIKFSISIDGFEKEHDLRRGPGCFRKTLNNALFLLQSGFFVNVTTTIDSKNCIYLADLVDFLATNFSRVTLLCIAQTGAANKHMDELGLDELSLNETITFLYKKISRKSSKKKCSIFPRSISVKYDGRVYPCSVARDLGLMEMGNILEEKTEEMVKNFLSSPDGKELLCYRSKREIKECLNCPALDKCSQGCRIRAKNGTGLLKHLIPSLVTYT